MGSGGGYHGETNSIAFDEMSIEQKEQYLQQQKQAKIRQAQYEEQQRKKKKKKTILIGIGVVIAIGLLIAIISWLAPAFKEGWELGKKIAG